MLLNAIAFGRKMSFTDLASLPCPTLIDQVLTPRDLWCKALLSFFRDQPCRESRVFFPVDTPITVLYFSVMEEFF